MVVDVFIYMYFVGLGIALGIATVVFVSWRLYKRMNNGKNKVKKRKGVI
jgi:hypothetical protein